MSIRFLLSMICCDFACMRHDGAQKLRAVSEDPYFSDGWTLFEPVRVCRGSCYSCLFLSLPIRRGQNAGTQGQDMPGSGPPAVAVLQ